jgi:hypothetical protein
MNVQKLAISMWEYSWLTRRWDNENEFADWEKVINEAKERGYNCLRIDPFPHLFLSERPDQIIIGQPKWAFWGSHSDVQVDIKKDLSEFMNLCKKKGLKIGLSGWYLPDEEKLVQKVKSKEGMLDMWLKTLSFLQEQDLLDILDWVDPVNEWPLSYPDPVSNNLLLALRRGKLIQKTNKFIQYVLNGLKNQFPDLKYTFSFTIEHFPRQKERKKLDLSAFDLLEIHTWLTSWIEFRLAVKHRTYQYSQLFPFRISIISFAKRARRKYYEKEEKWLSYFREELQTQIDWAKNLGIPIYNTEGFITVFYKNAPYDPEIPVWDWYRDASEKCHSIATELGFHGLCTSNFSEPYFGIWGKPEWHRKLNEHFLNYL